MRISMDTICSVSSTIQFEYHPGRWMHSFLLIRNLTDQVVSYRVRTNHPLLYLVKPIEGQIYNVDTLKVLIDRKPIPESQISTVMALNNEKFQVQFMCVKKDAVGRECEKRQRQQVVAQFIESRKRQVLRTEVNGGQIRIDQQLKDAKLELQTLTEAKRKIVIPSEIVLLTTKELIAAATLFFLIGLSM